MEDLPRFTLLDDLGLEVEAIAGRLSADRQDPSQSREGALAAEGRLGGTQAVGNVVEAAHHPVTEAGEHVGHADEVVISRFLGAFQHLEGVFLGLVPLGGGPGRRPLRHPRQRFRVGVASGPGALDRRVGEGGRIRVLAESGEQAGECEDRACRPRVDFLDVGHHLAQPVEAFDLVRGGPPVLGQSGGDAGCLLLSPVLQAIGDGGAQIVVIVGDGLVRLGFA